MPKSPQIVFRKTSTPACFVPNLQKSNEEFQFSCSKANASYLLQIVICFIASDCKLFQVYSSILWNPYSNVSLHQNKVYSSFQL